MHFRQEVLFVNLIRKILLKDFTFCDSAVDVSSIEESVSNVHLRHCTKNTNSRLPENSILRSVYNAQRLVEKNFEQMEALNNGSPSQGKENFLQQYEAGSTARKNQDRIFMH